jgi:hypothetical protein
MPEKEEVVSKKISKEWQDFLMKSFAANSMQFGLAAYLSTFGEFADEGWNRIFSHFKEGVLKCVDTQEDFQNLSEDLQKTLESIGLINNEKQMLSKELDKFENKFKHNIIAMAKKLHEFRENKTLELIKRLIGDDE